MSVDAESELDLLHDKKSSHMSVSYPNKSLAGAAGGGSNGVPDRVLGLSNDSGGDRGDGDVHHSGGRARLNTDHSIMSIDAYDVEEDARDGCVAIPMDPILVLWPPPQRMNRRNAHPFVLSNDAIITLSAPSAELHIAAPGTVRTVAGLQQL